MKLSYRILWLDDDEDFFDSQGTMLETLRTYIEEEGFDLDIDFQVSPDNIKFDEINNTYDLMVIDYHLMADGPDGHEVIDTIRRHDCLTEVIFYSSDALTTLRTKAVEKELEGVYFSTKRADVLGRKVEDVFDLTVRKVLDTDNMRGLVMAGVADIDHQLADLLGALHSKLDEEKQLRHRKKIVGKMLPIAKDVGKLFADGNHEAFDTLAGAIKALKDLDPQTFEHLMGHRGFDSNKRVDSVESFCGGYDELKPHKDEVASIRSLLKWRNALAHQVPRIADEIHLFQPDAGKEEAFNVDLRQELRVAMRRHRMSLAALMKAVQAIQDGA